MSGKSFPQHDALVVRMTIEDYPHQVPNLALLQIGTTPNIYDARYPRLFALPNPTFDFTTAVAFRVSEVRWYTTSK